jgi:hypothetical protein
MTKCICLNDYFFPSTKIGNKYINKNILTILKSSKNYPSTLFYAKGRLPAFVKGGAEKIFFFILLSIYERIWYI